MSDNVHLKFLNQKKENIIIKIRFVQYIINNHLLALERIKESIKFVNSENKKVLDNPNNSPELVAYLFVNMPPLNFGYVGFNDLVNFLPSKAEIVITDDKQRQMILGNYNCAIESWDTAKQKIINSKILLNEYLALLNDQLKEIEEKINTLLYSDVDGDIITSLKSKKKQKFNYNYIANMYVKSCKELKMYSPSADQLTQTNPEGPSRTDWYRKLKNPIVLITISNLLEKKLNNKKLKKSDIHFWLSVKENLSILVENVSSQISKSREIPIEDKLDFYESKFGISSHSSENTATNWDED